ncbi:MAG TPA: uridine kinase [Spirochaetia bacterium]|nr:uridine kinase [Spirochaetia bacterium]
MAKQNARDPGVRIIGISGGSGSGKTTIVRKIAEVIPDFVFVAQDNYYKSADQMPARQAGDKTSPTELNFDHPSAFDNELLSRQLRALKSGQPIDMPQYDFVHHRRAERTIHVDPKKIVIFEGILIFFDRVIRDLIDLKLYVDTPDDIRFIRRLKRDITERGRTVDSVINQYLLSVRPGHYEFIEPTKAYADLIVPEGGSNEKALEVLVSFMREIMA